MNTIDFCYWLQGYFEMTESKALSQTQTDIIRNHLNLVFKHEIDPLRESQTKTKPSVLNHAHSPSNDVKIRC